MKDQIFKSTTLYNRLKNDTSFHEVSFQDGNALFWKLVDNQSDSTVVLFSHFNSFIHENPENKGLSSVDIHMDILNDLTISNRNILMLVDFSNQVSRNRIFELFETLNLDVEYVIESEPQRHSMSQQYTYYEGAGGRVMPFILVRGSTHLPEEPFAGLGTIGMMNEIIKAVELNVEMCDSFDKQMVPPPRFITQAFKASYGVPEYGVSVFNWPYLHDALDKRFEQLKVLCSWSLEDAINQYNYSFNEFLRKQGMPSYECCHQFDVPILTMSEITREKQLKFESPAEILEAAEMLVGEAYADKPFVMIGLLPDFTPEHASKDKMLTERVFELIQSEGISVDRKNIMMDATSANVLSVPSNSWEFAQSQMPYAMDSYHLKGVPVLHLGPRYAEDGKSISRIDSVEIIPRIITRVIKDL